MGVRLLGNRGEAFYWSLRLRPSTRTARAKPLVSPSQASVENMNAREAQEIPLESLLRRVEVGIAAGAALYTALSYSGGNVMTKSLVRTEEPNAIVFYNFALLGVVSVGPALAVWTTPAWGDVSWILVFGVLSVLAQQCITRSFAAAPASVVIPFQFLKLPFVAAIALLWFAERPDPWTWLGALVIFASTYGIARRAARTRDDDPLTSNPRRSRQP